MYAFIHGHAILMDQDGLLLKGDLISMIQLSGIMRKLDVAYPKTKKQICSAVTEHLISDFAFATRIVLFLFFLNPKFQASLSSVAVCQTRSRGYML